MEFLRTLCDLASFCLLGLIRLFSIRVVFCNCGLYLSKLVHRLIGDVRGGGMFGDETRDIEGE